MSSSSNKIVHKISGQDEAATASSSCGASVEDPPQILAGLSRSTEGVAQVAINLDWLPDDALLKSRDFCALTSWSSSTLKRKWQDGTIPEPIRLGRNSLRWRVADIRATLAGLACKRLHSHSNLASV